MSVWHTDFFLARGVCRASGRVAQLYSFLFCFCMNFQLLCLMATSASLQNISTCSIAFLSRMRPYLTEFWFLHLLDVSDVELFSCNFWSLGRPFFFFGKVFSLNCLIMFCSRFPFLCSLFPALHLFSSPLSTSPLPALSLSLRFKSWTIQLHLDPMFLQKGKQVWQVYSAKDLRA